MLAANIGRATASFSRDSAFDSYADRTNSCVNTQIVPQPGRNEGLRRGGGADPFS